MVQANPTGVECFSSDIQGNAGLIDFVGCGIHIWTWHEMDIAGIVWFVTKKNTYLQIIVLIAITINLQLAPSAATLSAVKCLSENPLAGVTSLNGNDQTARYDPQPLDPVTSRQEN